MTLSLTVEDKSERPKLKSLAFVSGCRLGGTPTAGDGPKVSLRLSPPANLDTAGVDVHVRIGPRVDPHAANQIGMRALHDIHRHRHQLRVLRVHPAIAVRIDRNVDRVAKLVTAVTGCAADEAVVLRRAETGVDVERHVLSIACASPRGDLGKNQFELVEEPGVNSRVARPGVLVIAREKVREPQVTRDRQIEISRIDPDKPDWGLRITSARPVAPVKAHLIAVEHRAFLLGPGHQNGQWRVGHHFPLAVERELEAVEPGLVRRDQPIRERAGLCGWRGVASCDPGVLYLVEAALHFDRVVDGETRKSEAHLELTATTKGISRWPGCEGRQTDRLRIETLCRTQKCHVPDCRHDGDNQRDTSRTVGALLLAVTVTVHESFRGKMTVSN